MKTKNRAEISFHKGLWLAQNSNEIPDGYAFALSNLMLGPGQSSAMVRKGFANVAATNWPVGGKFDFFCKFDGSSSAGTGGTARGFFGSDGTNVYVQTYSGGVYTTEIKVWAYTITSAVEYDNYLFLGTESSVVQVATRASPYTVIVLPGGYPSYNTIFTHKSRIFGFHCNSTTPNRLGYSITTVGSGLSTADFPSANFIDVYPGDGQLLIGGASLNDRVILLKSGSVYTLFTGADPTTWQLRRINNYVGCTSRHSLVEYQNWIYFCGVKGIYRTDGITVEKISQALDYSVFDGRSATRKNDTHYDFAGIWNGHYVISLKNSPNTLYLYHFETGSWWKWDISSSLGLGFFTNFTDTEEALFAVCTKNSSGTTANAYIGRMVNSSISPYVYQDNSVAYTASLKTKQYNLGTVDSYKRCNSIDAKVVGRDGTVTLTPGLDNTDRTSTAYASLASGVRLLRAPAMNIGRTIGATVAFSGTLNTTEEHGIFDIGAEFKVLRDSPFANA